jgi:APA family basic amino acid/polyamine antiporter
LRDAVPAVVTTRRKLGAWMTTALVIGNIIGAGVFMLPSALAPFGWNGLFAWGLTLPGALCLAWVFATLARHLPDAGGAYGHIRVALGEGPSFVAAWGYWVSVWVANAAIATGGVSYLGRLVPAVESTPALGATITASVVIGLTWVNSRGARTAGWVQGFTTVVKLLPFAALPVLIAQRTLAEGGAALLPFDAGTVSLGATTAAMAFTLYAMLGLESASVPADQVEAPARTIPRATMVGTTLAALVTVMASSAVVLLMAPADITVSQAPVADFVAASWGPMAGAAIAACVVVSAYGCLNGWILLAAETPAVMAAAGQLPAWWGVRNAHGAPIRALLTSSTLTGVLIVATFSRTLAGAFAFASLLATTTILALYLLAPLAALRMMRDGRLPRSVGLTVATFGSIVFVALALLGAGREAVGWGLLLLGAGWPLHRLMAHRASRDARRPPATGVSAALSAPLTARPVEDLP